MCWRRTLGGAVASHTAVRVSPRDARRSRRAREQLKGRVPNTSGAQTSGGHAPRRPAAGRGASVLRCGPPGPTRRRPTGAHAHCTAVRQALAG